MTIRIRSWRRRGAAPRRLENAGDPARPARPWRRRSRPSVPCETLRSADRGHRWRAERLGRAPAASALFGLGQACAKLTNATCRRYESSHWASKSRFPKARPSWEPPKRRAITGQPRVAVKAGAPPALVLSSEAWTSSPPADVRKSGFSGRNVGPLSSNNRFASPARPRCTATRKWKSRACASRTDRAPRRAGRRSRIS